MGCPSECILGDTLVFTVTTHDPDTGVLTDADAVPSYRVYEDETGTAITNGNMAKLDDSNTTGFYSEALTCSAANGYEAGKNYSIYIEATVDSDKGGMSFGFKIAADPVYAGDYAVVLTVRTTAGSALSGVQVWLNTANTRSGAVAGPLYTDDSGQVTFYLNYTTYYIFCRKSGYSFAAASMTPAAGSVSFTKDIATALAPEGSDSDYNDSFLIRGIAEVRKIIDEPTTNAKWTDTNIVEQLEKSYIQILAEKSNLDHSIITVETEVTIDGSTSYELPGVLGKVLAIYVGDDYGSKFFYHTHSTHNPHGKSVYIEGKSLKVQHANYLPAGQVVTVEWIPRGIARLHTGTCTVNAAGDTVTFGATPFEGVLDTRLQAYAGCVLRIFNVTGTSPTGDYMQEREITSYDRTTRAATLDLALSPVPAAGSGGYIFYEIAPSIPLGMDAIVATHAAMTICGLEGNAKRARSILDTVYKPQIRDLRLDAYYSNLQDGQIMESDNDGNENYRGSGWPI